VQDARSETVLLGVECGVEDLALKLVKSVERIAHIEHPVPSPSPVSGAVRPPLCTMPTIVGDAHEGELNLSWRASADSREHHGTFRAHWRTTSHNPNITTPLLHSMSSQKRGNASNHYGDRNQHFNKKQRPSYSTTSYDDRSQNAYSKPQQRGTFNSLPGAAPSNQPALSAAEMQTGLVALLDRFVAAETTPAADKDILHHARELRRLLEKRGNATSAEAKRELDEKRPNKAANIAVPDYIDRIVKAAKDLPSLPPISEPHLQEAVFTHTSVSNTRVNGHYVGDLDVDYERLEFLGDAYIELIASRSLYNRFPQVDVPSLCSWRERLVENQALGKFSEAYGFPDRLNHKGIAWEKDSKAWKKVVADIFEAYVAAVVLSDPENGFSTVEKWLDELWAPQLLGFKEKVVENLRARDDLQRLIVVNRIEIKYREEQPMVMEQGKQKYFLGAYLTGWGYEDEYLGSGHGQNKAQACISAAADALKRNNAALQDAARQKKELMEVRAKEREEKAQAEALENGQGEGSNADEQKPAVSSARNGEDAGSATKKRKSDVSEESPEKKSKKHKKEKKEKKRKTGSDDES
jgi:ribonuclease-3